MSLPTLLFVIFVAGLTVNVYAPLKSSERLMGLTFGLGWLTGELAGHLAVAIIFITSIIAAGEGFEGFIGWVGLLVILMACGALARFHLHGLSIGPLVESSLQLGLGKAYLNTLLPHHRSAIPLGPDRDAMMLPFKRDWTGIDHVTDVSYDHANLKLDIYRPKRAVLNAPVLLHIHGGAWKIGDKYGQALPLMQAMTRLGWICVSISYRLSPKATFPDHIIDCKAALAWTKRHIQDYGGDPAFIAVTGGSAGGHLTGLMALAANDPAFQPGFEDQDTTIQAAVPFYGPFDWTDRDELQPNQGLRHLLEKEVIKSSFASSEAVYEAGSPLLRDLTSAPPMMIVHGDQDSLVPVGISRKMAALHRAQAETPCIYLEIPGAQHAFDIFASPRSEHTKLGVMRFLCFCYAEYHASKG